MNYYAHKASMATPLTWKEFFAVQFGLYILGVGPLLLVLFSGCTNEPRRRNWREELDKKIISQCKQERGTTICHSTSWKIISDPWKKDAVIEYSITRFKECFDREKDRLQLVPYSIKDSLCQIVSFEDVGSHLGHCIQMKVQCLPYPWSVNPRVDQLCSRRGSPPEYDDPVRRIPKRPLTRAR
jgi:hypothetical protein